MKYPIENLTDKEFENLVALICKEILGTATVVFSTGKDGGRDAKFDGVANCYPSKSSPWSGKIVIQAKHTEKINSSCSDSDFQTILKKNVLPSIEKLKSANKVDFYLLFTNRKLSGIQDAKIEDFFDENTEITNRVIGIETIDLWLTEYPRIARILNLNKLLLPLNFNENDLKEIINTFNKISDEEEKAIPTIPENRDIETKNVLNELSEEYFNSVIKKSLIYFDQIREFLTDEINSEYLNKYENTIDDINEEIVVHRDEFVKFEEILNFLYKFIVENNPELNQNRRLVRVFLHYMYYNCDIGVNE